MKKKKSLEKEKYNYLINLEKVKDLRNELDKNIDSTNKYYNRSKYLMSFLFILFIAFFLTR